MRSRPLLPFSFATPQPPQPNLTSGRLMQTDRWVHCMYPGAQSVSQFSVTYAWTFCSILSISRVQKSRIENIQKSIILERTGKKQEVRSDGVPNLPEKPLRATNILCFCMRDSRNFTFLCQLCSNIQWCLKELQRTEQSARLKVSENL